MFPQAAQRERVKAVGCAVGAVVGCAVGAVDESVVTSPTVAAPPPPLPGGQTHVRYSVPMEIALQRSFDDLGTPLSQVTFVVLDVETTGGSPATSSLTEVAAARYRGGEILGTYQTFVRPDERIPPFITALTGISDEMVADAPRSGEMLPSFLEFVGGAVLVGHNIRFDLSFLNHALVSTGRERLANVTVDTLAMSRRLVRDMVPNCKLGTLAATLRAPPPRRRVLVHGRGRPRALRGQGNRSAGPCALVLHGGHPPEGRPAAPPAPRRQIGRAHV